MIEHLWQSTLVATVAGLLAASLRRNQASVRHTLWLMASLKFLVPFSAIVALGRMVSWRQDIELMAQPALEAVLRVRGPLPPVPTDFVEVAASPALAAGPAFNVTSIASAIWIAGCLASVAVWAIRWRRMAALGSHGVAMVNGREVEILRRLEGERRHPLPTVLTESRFEPGVFGIVRPVLLWPAGISERLDDEHVEAVLSHELAHVERRDNLWAAAHTTVQSIFWFHPLVWWIGARLVAERERACDEAVIRRGSAPDVYAEGILRTCEHFVEGPLPCVAGVTGADLKERLAAIVTGIPARALSRGRRVLLTTAASLAVVAPLAVGAWQGAGAADASKTPDPLPKFEVAVVKQNRSGTNMATIGGGGGGGRYTSTNVPLRLLIRICYVLQDYQIVGGPDWISTDRFDIVAKAEGELPPPVPGQPNPTQLMVRALLAERFKLVVHRETREVPIFALVVARDDKRLGPQLKESAVDCAAEAAARRGAPPPPPPALGPRGPMTAPRCGAMMGPGTLLAGSTSMSQLATTLSNSVGRIVVDKTGLTGRYDIDLKWTPDGTAQGGGLLGIPGGAPGPGGPPPADPNGPSIFAAVQEQLGLKLESQRGPVEVLVIDSVERPTEN